MGNFHCIFESLPGIVTSYEDNLLKTKVCNNLRLTAENVIKNIQEIDWTLVKSLWQLTKACKEKRLCNWHTRFPVFTLLF